MPDPRRGLGKFLERQGSARAAPPTSTAPDSDQVVSTTGAPPAGRSAGTRRRATKDGREQLLVYLRPEGIRELKLAALEGDTTASAIVADALNAWFQRHSRPPVA